MGTQKNIIVLNGKKYNAATGEVLANSSIRPGANTPAEKVHIGSAARRIVDGVWGGKNKQPAKQSVAPKVTPKPLPAKRHQPERAKTLMRSSVKAPFRSTTSKVFDIGGKDRSGRDERAKNTPKSSLVGRFNSFNTPAAAIKKAGQVSRAAVASGVATSQSAVANLQMPASLNTGVNVFKDRLDLALQRASSHEQKSPKKPALHHRAAKKIGVKPKTLVISFTIFIAALLGSLLVYQNLPKFAIRVAAARAGFHASLPSYIPAGFNIESQIHYTSGKVSLNYHSNTDARAYSLVQQPSQWSSDSLLNDYVIAANKPYQTFQNNGKTIYIYDGSSATWVDGGIWYNVQSSGSLGTDQLLKVANSL